MCSSKWRALSCLCKEEEREDGSCHLVIGWSFLYGVGSNFSGATWRIVLSKSEAPRAQIWHPNYSWIPPPKTIFTSSGFPGKFEFYSSNCPLDGITEGSFWGLIFNVSKTELILFLYIKLVYQSSTSPFMHISSHSPSIPLMLDISTCTAHHPVYCSFLTASPPQFCSSFIMLPESLSQSIISIPPLTFNHPSRTTKTEISLCNHQVTPPAASTPSSKQPMVIANTWGDGLPHLAFGLCRNKLPFLFFLFPITRNKICLLCNPIGTFAILTVWYVPFIPMDYNYYCAYFILRSRWKLILLLFLSSGPTTSLWKNHWQKGTQYGKHMTDPSLD